MTARHLAPPKLSEEARAARVPRPPEELVGALQDRVMGSLDVDDPKLPDRVRKELAPLKARCHWTSGTWDDLGGIKWNELQNVPAHVRLLSNHVLRLALLPGGQG